MSVCLSVCRLWWPFFSHEWTRIYTANFWRDFWMCQIWFCLEFFCGYFILQRVLTGKFLLSLISDLKLPPEKIFGFIVHRVPPFCLKNLYVCTVCTCLKRLSQATAHSVDFAQDCFHMTFVKNFFPNFLSLIWNIFGQKESKKLHRVPNKLKPRKKKDELEVVHQIEMEKIPAWWNRAQFSYTLYILE